ncbi:NAD(P)H-hydrate dehydratase [Mangrovicella endophytica]|uniref:NAD(P)H-hydrate dehydratase n=1 Tax=Mangrovicella endophytica TaxID=2066697 RepID=UPI000C9EC1A4|nr:NAD(P)H-hydrate dehydratase [Mangrovicella endophytica]
MRTEAALLTPNEMGEADRLTIASGIAGMALMEAAGSAVVDSLVAHYPKARSIAILAGPGNNGGDAYAAGRLLKERGLTIRLFASQPPSRLSGDAALAAATFDGPSEPLAAFDPAGADLILDGLFGAGLARPVDGDAARAIDVANAAGVPIVAIDLPSGISGLTGMAMGTAIKAALTVTFFRRKPGHLLEPGRTHCGEVVVADIGIAGDVLDAIAPQTFINDPTLWREQLKLPVRSGHKYDRGHAVVLSGGFTTTGAARLAAMAALRGGAGLVTVFSPAGAIAAHAAHLTAIMLKRCEDEAELAARLADDRFNTFVLGPGFGIGGKARDFTAAILAAGRHLVLDADGITSFAEAPDTLFEAVKASAGAAVLTPHAGEFKRLFPDIAAGEETSKLEKARAAAQRSGAVVILKGSDTVIAAPDGRAAINATGTPWLASAGTGDVLAGIVAAQLAQGTQAFEAASAAVWMHGRAAELFGPGLISEDLPAMLPKVLAELV